MMLSSVICESALFGINGLQLVLDGWLILTEFALSSCEPGGTDGGSPGD